MNVKMRFERRSGGGRRGKELVCSAMNSDGRVRRATNELDLVMDEVGR